jgi:regulatory protein
MARVTAIKADGRRLKIALEDGTTFHLQRETAGVQGLVPGQEVSAKRLEELKKIDGFQRCYDAATNLLSYRPRSRAEVRERLLKRRFAEASVEKVLARLTEQGLLDDLAFARFWRESRTNSAPRSAYLTGLELRQKGVAAATIEEVVATIDDEEAAYKAARGRAGKLPADDYQLFRRRLGDYLRRRGFGYGVITATVNRLWQEFGSR